MPADASPLQDIDVFARDYVANAARAFRPYASYSPTADAVFVYVKDEAAYHKRVDDMFTILYSDERQFLGCVIKGIRSLWENAPASATFSAIFEQYVRRNPKVVWEMSEFAKDLKSVTSQEVALPA